MDSKIVMQGFFGARVELPREPFGDVYAGTRLDNPYFIVLHRANHGPTSSTKRLPVTKRRGYVYQTTWGAVGDSPWLAVLIQEHKVAALC